MEMKNILYYILPCIMLQTTSCSEDENIVWQSRNAQLSAVVEQTREARSPYTETVPSLNHELHVAVWASTKVDPTTNLTQFKDENLDGRNDSEISKHTKANFQNGKDQLLIDIIYSDNGKNVKFVGFHPENIEDDNDVWKTNEDGAIATMDFSGTEDVMFAPEVSGTYGMSTNPKLRFHHLLTWLNIQMVAESEDARDAWGSIEDITIKSSKTVTIEINHGAEVVGGYNRYNHVSYSNLSDFDIFFIEEGNDKEFPENCEGGKYVLKGPKVGYEANWNSFVEDVGYVMCAPVDASISDVDYTITVKSERRTVDIPVNLLKSSNSEYTENTMGKQFTILLKFNIGDNIAVSTTVDNWKTGGFSKGDITE